MKIKLFEQFLKGESIDIPIDIFDQTISKLDLRKIVKDKANLNTNYATLFIDEKTFNDAKQKLTSLKTEDQKMKAISVISKRFEEQFGFKANEEIKKYIADTLSKDNSQSKQKTKMRTKTKSKSKSKGFSGRA